MIRYATVKPAHYHNDFELFLYHHEVFLQLKNIEFTTFYALDDEHSKVIAQIHFVIDKEHLQAISLPQSPFGSVVFSDILEENEMYRFVMHIIEYLQGQNIGSIEIIHYPVVYERHKTQTFFNSLKKAGFYTSKVVTSHHIPVDMQIIDKKLHAWEQRKLKKCRNAGFTFAIEPLTSLSPIYYFISSCRTKQHRQLSMSYGEVEKYIKALPDAYKLFAVYDQQQMIAASITVKVNKNILYTFYYAGLATYNRFSPTVLLLEGIYKFCQKSSISIMDLGTSPSETVRSFKLQMGGVASEKVNWLYSVKPQNA